MMSITTHADHGEDDVDDDDDDVGGGQSWAFFTLDTLASTPKGVTSPMTVTFFVAKSILNDVTPAFVYIILSFFWETN